MEEKDKEVEKDKKSQEEYRDVYVLCTYLQSDVSTSHNLTVPSSPPDTMYCPSGERDIARTGPL